MKRWVIQMVLLVAIAALVALDVRLPVNQNSAVLGASDKAEMRYFDLVTEPPANP